MRIILIALLFLASCSKEEAPQPETKNCYPVTKKYIDANALRYYIYYSGTRQVEVSGTVFNQYEVGQDICFDRNNNIVK